MSHKLMSAEAPLLLSSTVSLAENSTGNSNSQQLQPEHRQGMWIDSINWLVTGSGGTLSGIAATGTALPGLVAVKMSLGRMEISHKFIPLWSYCTDLQFITQSLFSQSDYPSDPAEPHQQYAMMRWKLPKPLYVPAGMQLTTDVARGADGCGGEISITTSYVGRFANVNDPPPKSITVRYVSAWTSNWDTASVTTQQSGELDLVNPFLVPLQVQRFTGRLLQTNQAGVTGETFAINAILPSTAMQLTMKDSYGNNIVRDFTFFGEVFDTLRRAWTFHKTLLAKERYYVFLQDIPAQVIAHVAIIGERKEMLS